MSPRPLHAVRSSSRSSKSFVPLQVRNPIWLLSSPVLLTLALTSWLPLSFFFRHYAQEPSVRQPASDGSVRIRGFSAWTANSESQRRAARFALNSLEAAPGQPPGRRRNISPTACGFWPLCTEYRTVLVQRSALLLPLRGRRVALDLDPSADLCNCSLRARGRRGGRSGITWSSAVSSGPAWACGTSARLFADG